MLNPVPCSKAERTISLKAEDQRKWESIKRNPLRLDLAILSTYMDNWRLALADLADMFHEQVSVSSMTYLIPVQALTSIQRRFILAAKFNIVRDFQDTINFTTMSKLQALEEKVQVIPNMIRSSITLLDHLVTLSKALCGSGMYDELEQEEVKQSLDAMRTRADGYLATSVALETRINGIFKLVRHYPCRVLDLHRLILSQGLERNDSSDSNNYC